MPPVALSQAAQAHHEAFKVYFRKRFGVNKPAPFVDYMEAALYAPGLGYYSAGATKLGEGGDFVTAPEISPWFSVMLARQCAEVLRELHGGAILELGPGRGVMAADVLKTLAAMGVLPRVYYCLERSADLRARQQAHLAASLPADLFDRLAWLDSTPPPFVGVILANEVVDALPVALFRQTGSGLQERFVVLDAQGEFQWCEGEPVTADLAQAIAAWVPDLALGYQSEWQPYLASWVKSVTGAMQQGVALFIDYGFPKHEYYHPERSMGTLKCHYQHQAHDEPLLYGGCQDITAHVDFTRLAMAGCEAGLSVAGYSSQAGFLTNLAVVAAGATEPHGMNQQAVMNRLLSPNEMGELFKVLALSRNFDLTLTGFSAFDRRDRL